jgi:hypothetical protein
MLRILTHKDEATNYSRNLYEELQRCTPSQILLGDQTKRKMVGDHAILTEKWHMLIKLCSVNLSLVICAYVNV